MRSTSGAATGEGAVTGSGSGAASAPCEGDDKDAESLECTRGGGGAKEEPPPGG